MHAFMTYVSYDYVSITECIKREEETYMPL